MDNNVKNQNTGEETVEQSSQPKIRSAIALIIEESGKFVVQDIGSMFNASTAMNENELEGCIIELDKNIKTNKILKMITPSLESYINGVVSKKFDSIKKESSIREIKEEVAKKLNAIKNENLTPSEDTTQKTGTVCDTVTEDQNEKCESGNN